MRLLPRRGHRHRRPERKRSGNAIKLAILWAKEVNGDRSARMTIEKIGSNGMRLTTIDTDPKTGKGIVTSQINLRRGF